MGQKNQKISKSWRVLFAVLLIPFIPLIFVCGVVFSLLSSVWDSWYVVVDALFNTIEDGRNEKPNINRE